MYHFIIKLAYVALYINSWR